MPGKKKVDECGGCGLVDVIKNKVSSVIHKHHAAHKCQKTVKAEIAFRDVETGAEVALCESCQNLVIGGTFHGRNWK